MAEYICTKCFRVRELDGDAPTAAGCCAGTTLVLAADACRDLMFRYEAAAEHCRRRERRSTVWSAGGLLFVVLALAAFGPAAREPVAVLVFGAMAIPAVWLIAGGAALRQRTGGQALADADRTLRRRGAWRLAGGLALGLPLVLVALADGHTGLLSRERAVLVDDRLAATRFLGEERLRDLGRCVVTPPAVPVELLFDVDTAGRVQSVDVRRMPEGEARSCLLATLRGFTFPPPREITVVWYSYDGALEREGVPPSRSGSSPGP